MPSKHSVLREGVLAGLSGAAAIAIWFLLLDTMRGAPLATPALLGSHLLQAVGVGSTSVSTATQVLSYTIVHFGLFILVGIIAATIVRSAERTPAILIGVGLLFVTFEVLVIGVSQIVGSGTAVALPRLHVIGSNLVAAVVMAAALWRTHRTLPHRLKNALANDVDDITGRPS